MPHTMSKVIFVALHLIQVSTSTTYAPTASPNTIQCTYACSTTYAQTNLRENNESAPQQGYKGCCTGPSPSPLGEITAEGHWWVEWWAGDGTLACIIYGIVVALAVVLSWATPPFFHWYHRNLASSDDPDIAKSAEDVDQHLADNKAFMQLPAQQQDKAKAILQHALGKRGLITMKPAVVCARPVCPRAFTGAGLVELLVMEQLAPSREEAAVLGQWLVDLQLANHVVGKQK